MTTPGPTAVGAAAPRGEERAARVRRWVDDREECLDCGYLRINVRHEPDPDNAPEGRAYYNAIRDQMHPFRSRVGALAAIEEAVRALPEPTLGRKGGVNREAVLRIIRASAQPTPGAARQPEPER